MTTAVSAGAEATAGARARATQLMNRRSEIEAQIAALMDVLKTNNNAGMDQPLVDSQGFPRADIDIYAVRQARVSIIRLRNDYKAITDEMEALLHQIHAAAKHAAELQAQNGSASNEMDLDEAQPFARVNGVAPDSPSWTAGLQRGDLITKFGSVSLATSNGQDPIRSLVSLVESSENMEIEIEILRDGTRIGLEITPKVWSGRGLLGKFELIAACNFNLNLLMAFFGDPLTDSLVFSSEDAETQQPAQQQTSPSSGWSSFSWGGILDAVKKQSEAVVDVYKRDLSEFVSTVAAESSSGAERLVRNIHSLASAGLSDAAEEYTINDNANKMSKTDSAAPMQSDSAAVLDHVPETNAPEFVDPATLIKAADSATNPSASPKQNASKIDATNVEIQNSQPSASTDSDQQDATQHDQTKSAQHETNVLGEMDKILDQLDEIAEKAENFIGQQLSTLSGGITRSFQTIASDVGSGTKMDKTQPSLYSTAQENVTQKIAEDNANKNDAAENVDEDALLNRLDAMAEQAENFVGHQLSSIGTGFTSLFSTVTQAATSGSVVSVLRSDAAVAAQRSPRTAIKYDRRAEMLRDIAQDPSTYLDDPRDLVQTRDHTKVSKILGNNPESYAARFMSFSKTYDAVGKAGQIAMLLSSNQDVARNFEMFVPDRVAYDEFWMRYFFRVSEVEREEEMRKRLVEQAAMGGDTGNDDEFAWDSDEDEPLDGQKNAGDGNKDTKLQNDLSEKQDEIKENKNAQSDLQQELVSDKNDADELSSESQDKQMHESTAETVLESTNDNSDAHEAAIPAASVAAVGNARSSEDQSTESFEIVNKAASVSSTSTPNSRSEPKEPSQSEPKKSARAAAPSLLSNNASVDDDEDDWGEWD